MFTRNTPRKDVEELIEVIMQTAKVATEEVFTTRARTSFGIVRFPTQKEKREFKKWLAGLKGEEQKMSHQGKKLRLSDNLPKHARARGRAVAKVKRVLMEANRLRTDVTIERDQRQVYVGSKRVAT